VKGRGVSFMEHPAALREGGGTYGWHAGAPDDEAFERAFRELADRIEVRLASLGLGSLELEPVAEDTADGGSTLEGEPTSGAGEQTRIVYACHYAGLSPAGPGKSHQRLRDVSLLGALPNMTVVQPANAEEKKELLRWAVEDAGENVALRLAIGPSPRRIDLPP